MDKKAMYRLSYGLFVVTAKEGEKDNGCITNTVMQVTSSRSEQGKLHTRYDSSYRKIQCFRDF